MNKLLALPIFFLVLSGCRLTPSSSSTLSSTTSIPIPNEDFNPIINGRTILKETVIETSYQIINPSVLNPLPLAEFNFPAIEDVVPPYAVSDAILGDFANQSIQFSNQTLVMPSNVSSLSVNQSIEDQEVVQVLSTLQPTDERFNQLQSQRKHRDLSHVYFGSDYYWFNQFVEEEEITLTRHTNPVIYGQWQMHKMFQTEVTIPISVDYQLYADASMIYEIRDETYPIGFFGAQDQKFETIRTVDNYKLALTMGPITTMVQQWQRFANNQTPNDFVFHGDITLANRSLTITKLAGSLYEFKIEVFIGATFESAEENYQMRAVLRNGEWESVEQHYQLWQPSPINP